MPVISKLPRMLELHRSPERGGAAECEEAPPLPPIAVPLNGFVPEPPTVDEMQIVQRVFFLAGDKVPRVVVFCGIEEGDGADAVCARTAEVLSSMVSEAVCLMDANLRAPSLHLRYDIDESLEFRDAANCSDADPADRLRGPSLWVLPAAALKNARPGFSPEQVRARLSTLRKQFGFLLMVAPPLSTAAEGFLLGQVADGVVLAVMAHSTRRAVALKVRRNLELYNVRVLGAVLNERLSKSTRAAMALPRG